MKEIKWINFICYVLVTYILSSLYGIVFRLTVPEILKFENLDDLSILFLVLLIIGYLLVNYFRSIKEVFESGAKKLFYIFIFIMGVNTNDVALIYAVSICLIGAYTVLFIEKRQIKKNNKIDESENEPELYPSRKSQEDILNHVLKEYSLIVLDGTWGSGKTTFMNIVMKKYEEDYYYIPIDIMLFENKSSLKREFLNHLKEIFKKNGILQGTLIEFDHCLNGVSNDLFKLCYKLFISKSKTIQQINRKIIKEIKKLDKKIVVGIDNLERIYSNSESEWKEIMGFIYELQELGIKIVVIANFEKMLGDKSEKLKLKLIGLEEENKNYPKEIKIEQDKNDNDNYDYFDKFYEFKLQLNEVTTEEIIDEVKIKKEKIDQVEIKESTVDKEWLKEQVKELTNNINQGFDKLNEGGNNKDKEERNKKYLEYKDLYWRYLNGIKNPRKIEKLIKDIQTKQNKIRNIFNFIGEEDYKKLIFRTSLYEVMFFDCAMEHKKKIKIVGNLGKELKTDEFIKHPFSKMFFQAFGYLEFKDERAINRLLYYDSKEDLVIGEINKLISTEDVSLSTINNRLNDLENYSNSLDPDYDQETTKKAYKIIEKKLAELEKTNKEKTHKIIKENEENICRLNYLTYPDELGIYEKINYKFKIESKYEKKGILNVYSNLLNELDKIINQLDFNMERRDSLRELIGFRNAILIFSELTKQPNLGSKEISELYKKHSEGFTIDDIQKLKNTIKTRVKSNYIKEELEEKIFKRLLNLLEILKINLTISNVIIKSSNVLEDLEKYSEIKDGNKKTKFLDEILWRIRGAKEDLSSKVIQEISDLLNKIMKNESNFELLFKLYKFNEECEIRKLPKQIKEKSEEILNMDKDNKKEKIERMKKELIDFINKKVKEVRWQYIFNGSWDKDLEKLKEIGIEVDFATKKVFKVGK